MLDLYYWPTSNGRKITIMLHEVELPYTIIPVNFKIGEQYAPEFLAINPNSKIPAIVDHDPIGGGAPLAIFESVAILIYLAEKSGRLMPHGCARPLRGDEVGDLPGREHRPDVRADGLFPRLRRTEHARSRSTVTRTRCGGSTRCWSAASARPSISPGDYSIADIAVWPWIQPARQEQRFEDYPNLKRWHDAVAARPAVRTGNAVRLDLQQVGVQSLSETERKSLYGRSNFFG